MYRIGDEGGGGRVKTITRTASAVKNNCFNLSSLLSTPRRSSQSTCVMFDLSCLNFFSPWFNLVLSKVVEIPQNHFCCEIQTDLVALGSPLLCLRVCKTVLLSFSYDLKLNLVLKLDFDAFKKSHLISPIMLRKLFARTQEFL